ncbi:MAG: putative peptidyl-prolyl cis-trans isomerase Cbf2 precursor [Syntrophorhabdaceae bacterium PtaU1.Bin034]|nr:MAG: putative peptidyl-prolyl cis-trans isomerase Cbf2 precursor [Syntrophorhabdaceae bacterium PtaU1.Bin034]
MKKYLVLLLLFLPLFACSKKEEGKVVATIDGEKVTMQEFNSELDKIPMNMKMLVATPSGKKNFLDRLVVKKLLLKEAKKENLEKDKEFQDRLSDIKEQLIIETLLKKKVSTESKFSDQDLQKYYDSHKEEFKKEREIETRQIVVKTEQEAKEIQARIAKGEDFAELAKKYSIDPSAKTTGGNIGYHPKGTLIPEYEEAAFKLTKVGQIAPPVKTQLGYHIIKLEGMRAGTYVPFAEVKDFIRQKMMQEKQTEVLQGYIEDLKKNAKVVINEDVLKEEAKKDEAPAKTEGAEKAAPDAKAQPEAQKEGAAPAKTEAAPAKTETSSTKTEAVPKK